MSAWTDPVMCDFRTMLMAGDKIQGRFLCRKSATNSRELDVEIHYGLEGSKDKVAAVFKVC